jgi:hypothetical protein
MAVMESWQMYFDHRYPSSDIGAVIAHTFLLVISTIGIWWSVKVVFRRHVKQVKEEQK